MKYPTRAPSHSNCINITSDDAARLFEKGVAAGAAGTVLSFADALKQVRGEQEAAEARAWLLS